MIINVIKDLKTNQEIIAPRIHNNSWKIKMIGYFNPNLEIEKDGIGDYNYVGLNLHYKNVTIFIKSIDSYKTPDLTLFIY